jgi:hypothetical protein
MAMAMPMAMVNVRIRHLRYTMEHLEMTDRPRVRPPLGTQLYAVRIKVSDIIELLAVLTVMMQVIFLLDCVGLATSVVTQIGR